MPACTTAATTAVTQQTNKNSGTVYQDDIQVVVNGVTYNGIGVIPVAPYYNLQITSKVDVNMLEIQSCGRDIPVQSAIKTNWLHPKRTYSYQYVPQPGVEDRGSCLLRLGAYNESGGQNAWGLFDFRTAKETMYVQQMCNGTVENDLGVSACETKVGVITRLVFPVPVRQDLTPATTTSKAPVPAQCLMTNVDGGAGKIWESDQPQAGECVTAWQQIDKPHALHRHTEKRYTDTLIRGD